MILDRALRFMDAREPGFMDKIRGADAESLDRIEARIGAKLPASYREYLEAFGEDNGGFDIFPMYASRAQDLLTYYPEPGVELAYDPHRYLKIAICVDQAREEPLDFFLDLARGDADDAPLVTFEDQSGIPHEEQADVEPIDVQYWFGDIVHLSALRQYDLDRRAHRARLSLTARFTPENEERWMDQAAWWSQVCELLSAWSFDEPFPGRAFRCGVSADATFSAERLLDGVSPIILRLGSDDDRALLRREEQIRDHLAVVGEEGRNETLE